MSKYRLQGYLFAAISMAAAFGQGTEWDITWAATVLASIISFIAHDIIEAIGEVR